MDARRARAWLIGLGLFAAAFGTARAEPGETPDDGVAVSVDTAAPALRAGQGASEREGGAASVAADDAAPAPATAATDRGAETTSHPSRDIAAASEPAATGAVVELALPALPEAPVIITERDALSGAVAVRLADGRPPFPGRLGRREREAVAAFYAARSDAPLWIRGGRLSGIADGLVARLRHADEDGLDPSAYPVPRLGVGPRPDSLLDLADADIRLSAAAVLYARDARGGRLDLARLSKLITPKLDLPAPDAVLSALATAADADGTLAGFNPQYPGYRALRDKLAEVRAGRSGTPMARASRRGPATVQSVAATQSIAALDDGDGPSWRSPVAVSAHLEGDLVANMERWRWLPAETSARYVAVNIPEFRLRIVDDGRIVHETRVITGKPEAATPVFSGLLEYAVVNPSWYIPPSIMKKEILPGLAADPSYAARRGYEVIRRGGAISVRQPPGERNALGFVKFMFPNQHAVYLHDTPNRSLFASERRAFSHGCVRVEHPFELADFLLGHEWSEARLKRLIGHGERTIFMPQKVPVHLTYFTLAVDKGGELRSFDDLYGYNRRVRAALGYGA